MRRPNRVNEKIELIVYLRALPLLVLNPILLLAPLLASVVDDVLVEVLPGDFTQFFIVLLDLFGLAISVIVADMIWRRGRPSFDEAWDDAKRKAADILIASIGLSVVLNLAFMAGAIITPLLGLVLEVVAAVFLVYTIAAATMSGVPGGLALQKSIDTVRVAPLNAIILSAVTLAAYYVLGTELPAYARDALEVYVPAAYLGDFGTVSLVIAAVCKAIGLGYVSLIVAERFNALNFSGRY